MTIDFYYLPGSAPCRSILLAAKALGINLNLKLTDLMKGEHMTPEYLKMNPQHTVPTINDDGFCLWESRAILTYLVDQYGEDDTLYPKDVRKRAIVEQRLYFDACTLYQRFGDLYYPIIFGGAPSDPAKVEKLEQAFEFLDTFLNDATWVAGDNLTIADLALVASVSTVECVDFPISKYANVQAWYERVKKTAPGYEVNASGCEAFKQMIQQMKKKV